MFPQMNLQYKLVSYFPRTSNLTNKSPHMDDSLTGHFVPKLINTQPVIPQREVDYLPPSYHLQAPPEKQTVFF